MVLILLISMLPIFTIPGVGAASWTGPVTVTNDTNNHYSSSLVQDQKGNVYLFWDQNPGIYYIITNTGQIASNTWPAPKLYTRNSNYDVTPAPVALKNGTLILFFSSKRGNTYNIYYSKSNDNGLTWSSEPQLTNTNAMDQHPSATQDTRGNIWVAWSRQETGDIKIRFVDTNGNGVWDQGESIVYDQNGNGLYDAGEPVIAGTAPAVGTALKVDARLAFYDFNNNGTWDSGEFVVYDSSVNSIYDPKLMYVDSNNNNVWDPGEPIIYKGKTPNGTLTSIAPGAGRCAGTSPPIADCVIIGTAPTISSILKIDPHIKFVDLNRDGLWESGETLVYDVNNTGQYAANDLVVAALVSDNNLKFISSNATWTLGNTVVYDSNGNGVYDGKIKYVDDNNTGHWVTGDTVIYDANLNNLYDYADTPIYDPACALGLSSCDFLSHSKLPKNDPGLRFIDTNGNGIWDQGEAVVYDSNLNGAYDGKLMFAKIGSNTTWVRGETVVYDTNGDGKYSTGRYYNDTIVSGIAPANNTVLTKDPSLKFFDTNDNMIWNLGETVVYDANNNNLYNAETTIATPVPNPSARLANDPAIKFVGAGTSWVSANPVVYDSNGNGLYDSGEPVIYGAAPANQTSLKFDPNIRYVNATINPSETWTSGKSVVYDANGNHLYDAETIISGPSLPPLTGVTSGLGEPVIAGASPNVGSTLKTDPKIKYFRTGTNTTWVPGETIAYDTNGNGVFDAGEPIILGPPLSAGSTLTIDSKLRYFDTNGNGVWDSSEPIVYDDNNNSVYDFGEYTVRGAIPQAGTVLTANIGEPWLAGSTAPVPGTSLKLDALIKFDDLNANSRWDANVTLASQYTVGEPVEYDKNNNGVFDTGTDIIIAGSPVPSIGTLLKTDEITLAGKIVPIGSKNLIVDAKIRFVNATNTDTWSVGKTVVYDSNSNNLYDAGEPVITGTAPAVGTKLKSDSLLKFVDSNGNSLWQTGEPVFYDCNRNVDPTCSNTALGSNNGVYDAGEPVVAVWPVPATSASLTTDTHIKYWDTNSTGHWLPGYSIVYDQNNNGIVDAGEVTIAGPVASTGTTLASDPKIKFVNTVSGNNTWAKGEVVVYDNNGNSIYDVGEPVIAGNTPSPVSLMRTVKHIFYRVYSGGVWQPEQRLTSQPANDASPSITQTTDGRVWVAWSGERTGGTKTQIIVVRSTSDGTTWSPEQIVSSVTTYGDKAPSIAQDRNGTIWLVWSRNVACSCGQAAFEADLYYAYSTNNGVTFTPETALTSTISQDEIDSNLSQLTDKNLYLFFTVIATSGSNVTVNLNYYKTLVQMHDARMNSFTTNATISPIYGPTLRAGQWLRLNTNASNTGDFSDTFTVTIKANSTLVASNTTTFTPGQTKIIILNWSTSGVKTGRYVLTANVTTTGEGLANLVDNALTTTIIIRPAGDVNVDCSVNIIDLVLVAGSFGKTAGSPGYNPIADVNYDGRVDIIDLSIVGSTFGQTC